MAWDGVQLGRMCAKAQYGYTSTSSMDANGPKYLRVTDIRADRIDWRAVPRCEILKKDLTKYLLVEGDIVVARSGSVGYAKQIRAGSPDAVFASYLVRFRPTTEVCGEYVGLVVTSRAYRSFIEANATGAAQPNANAQVLASFPVPVPPLPLQRKIAAVLGAYDELIENNLRRIEILEEMAQAIYREWFVCFRYPGHEADDLVDSSLGPIPEGWAASTLGDQADMVMGQSPRSEFYNEDGAGLPFHQGVSYFGKHFPTHIKYCTVKKRIARAGDTLVSVRAPVGRINVADTDLIVGRGLAAVASSSGHQGFLYRQLREHFREEDSMGGGTIFKAITKGDLGGVPIVVPPADLVGAFERNERPMFELVTNLSRQNTNLRTTRDLLLPKLISGEIDVSDLDIDTSWLVA
ncbi:restriction endonuclease subunit S [soil metagenome]